MALLGEGACHTSAGVAGAESPPLIVGRARPRGRRVLWALVGFTLLLGVGYAILVRATRIAPPPIAAEERTRAELPIEARGARAYVGPAWMGRERGVWEIHLEGDPYQIGWAHARLGQQMHLVQEDYLFDEFARYVPSLLARFAIKNIVRVAFRKLDDFIPLPRREELAGEAAATIDLHADFLPIYQRLVYYHSLHDITQNVEHSPLLGCSAFAASGPASSGGHLIIGRNFDFEGPEPFDRDKAVIFIREKGRVPLVSVAWAGMGGVVTGINAEGVYVSINAARTDDKGAVGMPVELLVREILGQAHSIDDVVRLVRDTPVLVPDLYLVGDGKTGESAVIERSPHRTEVRRARDVSILTNHALTTPFASDAENDRLRRYLTSGARYKRLEELVRHARGTLDPKRALEILRDKRGPGGEPLGLGNRNALDAIIATHSVIIDATAMTMWVGTGPHLLGRFVGFDLRHELSGEERPAPPDLPADPIADSTDLAAYREALTHLAASQRLMKVAPDRAIEELERAAGLQPNMPEPQRLLGDARHKRGDVEGARRAYRRFLELSPPYLKDVEEVKGLLGTI
jgi:isopenicillin-N N-acyltransferase-like protein